VSIARAVVEAAQYGLEPTGAIGGAHLVPYRNKRTGRKEAQLIIDYRGLVRLARRSGEVSKVWARTVRERDAFLVEAGTDDRIMHRPYIGPDDPGNYTHVYAVMQYRDGSIQFDWDTWAWVQTIRKRSTASDAGPWVTDEAEMAKKSILRRMLKTAPLTVELRAVIEAEEQTEAELAQARAGRNSRAVAMVHERLGIAAPAGATETAATEDPGPSVPPDQSEAPRAVSGGSDAAERLGEALG
jgi:recombination protein RecT